MDIVPPRLRLPAGYLRDKKGEIWYDYHHIAKIVSVGSLNELRERESSRQSKARWEEGKCYCNTCNQNLEYKVEGWGCHERHLLKICKCHIPK